jgi:hypothetical protein
VGFLSTNFFFTGGVLLLVVVEFGGKEILVCEVYDPCYDLLIQSQHERNQCLIEDSESNVLFQKSSLLRSFLDWVIVNVPNFDL